MLSLPPLFFIVISKRHELNVFKDVASETHTFFIEFRVKRRCCGLSSWCESYDKRYEMLRSIVDIIKLRMLCKLYYFIIPFFIYTFFNDFLAPFFKLLVNEWVCQFVFISEGWQELVDIRGNPTYTYNQTSFLTIFLKQLAEIQVEMTVEIWIHGYIYNRNLNVWKDNCEWTPQCTVNLCVRISLSIYFVSSKFVDNLRG